MSNVLKVSQQGAIRSLQQKGGAERRIARELGINRRTVSRHISKCTIPPTGNAGDCGSKCTIVPAGNSADRQSQCEPFSEPMAGNVELGLSAQRIYQDLVEQHGFAGSCDAVKRYVGRFRKEQPERKTRGQCSCSCIFSETNRLKFPETFS
jgi:hypothetical protein